MTDRRHGGHAGTSDRATSYRARAIVDEQSYETGRPGTAGSSLRYGVARLYVHLAIISYYFLNRAEGRAYALLRPPTSKRDLRIPTEIKFFG